MTTYLREIAPFLSIALLIPVVLLPIEALAVVGGLGSIPGAVLGAFVVGVGEEMSVLFFDPTYRTAVGFFAILIVLTLRPRGLLGERAV